MNRQQLIEDNINLVYFVVHTYYPSYIRDEDIIQTGMLALCRAADTFDETKSKFTTYASRSIRNEINYELRRRKNRVPAVSLDCVIYQGESEKGTYADLQVGDEDVQYVDLDAIYKRLKPKERKIFDLMKSGLTPSEIAREMGMSNQLVSYYLRIIRLKWRKAYGS